MNPISEISAYIPPIAMQLYVIVMVILVIGGTVLDTIHKKSARYFFENAKKSQANRERELGGGEKIFIAVQTAAVDVLASGEFCISSAPSCPILPPSVMSSAMPAMHSITSLSRNKWHWRENWKKSLLLLGRPEAPPSGVLSNSLRESPDSRADIFS